MMQKRFAHTQKSVPTGITRRSDRSIRRAGYTMIGGILLSLCYYWFLEPMQFGGNATYKLLANYIPVGLGIALVFTWLRPEVAEVFTSTKVVLRDKLFFVLLLVVIGSVGGYTTVGLLFRIVWDRVNAAYGARQPLEHDLAEVRSVSTSRGSGIHIIAKGYSATIDATYEELKAKQTRDSNRYLADLSLRRGLLGTWLIKDWKLVDKP
ncbi:hypothetical protein EPD60_02300 [Flaviaesturariibacter flavus]|uniref:Uncharacterized protein n=1 Tax=Flaviaesturariibacter flavus TaxID=2502780 RepID=A0A4R1BNR4_9BACT|nr:hypothetical protein [Flaviaesturariibacter flavus]TCJ19270.1 hypothetical protein EPD60_02300 [Flaviaesturariibacter flavus]